MKPNKNHAEIISHVHTLLGIDIVSISTPIKRRGLTLDVSRLTQNEIRNIFRIANSYEIIRVEGCGHKRLYLHLMESPQ